MLNSKVMVVSRVSDGDINIMGVFVGVTEEEQRAVMLTEMTLDRVEEYVFDFEYVATRPMV
jgi:hypothetical protein